MVGGPRQPHVGPDHDAYLAAHKETVGHESDEWWAEVSILPSM
jgi:acetyl-CoA synthetase